MSVEDTLIALKTIDNEGEWKVTVFVRAIDACRVPVPKDKPLDGGGGGCILYTRLALSGPPGTVAVGDSYALVPNKKMCIWKPLMLTGESWRSSHYGVVRKGIARYRPLAISKR